MAARSLSTTRVGISAPPYPYKRLKEPHNDSEDANDRR